MNLVVMAIFKTNEGYKSAGSVVAQVGCWSMLKGGITVESLSSGPAQLYFQVTIYSFRYNNIFILCILIN